MDGDRRRRLQMSSDDVSWLQQVTTTVDVCERPRVGHSRRWRSLQISSDDEDLLQQKTTTVDTRRKRRATHECWRTLSVRQNLCDRLKVRKWIRTGILLNVSIPKVAADHRTVDQFNVAQNTTCFPLSVSQIQRVII